MNNKSIETLIYENTEALNKLIEVNLKLVKQATVYHRSEDDSNCEIKPILIKKPKVEPKAIITKEQVVSLAKEMIGKGETTEQKNAIRTVVKDKTKELGASSIAVLTQDGLVALYNTLLEM